VSGPLAPADRRTLLGLARAAILDRLRSDGTLERFRREARITPALEETRGAFVSLHVADRDDSAPTRRLRGCIGTIRPEEALHLNVVRNAVHSAFDDPRFPPLVDDEYARLHVEISALTPVEPAGDPESIVPGRDGVILNHAAGSAVFLPQVAVEQGWDARALLENLALKAGLPRDAWRDARIEVFEAEVFGEDTVDRG